MNVKIGQHIIYNGKKYKIKSIEDRVTTNGQKYKMAVLSDNSEETIKVNVEYL